MFQNPIILFDGYCNLCSYWVHFILNHDSKKKFRFCALHSPASQKLLNGFKFPDQNNTVVLLMNNLTFTKSTAALKILKELGGLWSMFYVFIIIPRFIRDAVYDLIAKYRYKWFGKKVQCHIPSVDERIFFIDQ